MNFLIIGSGPAGIFASEAIRMQETENSITMVTEDRGVAHSPVMLTYWMAGDRPREILFFRDPSWAEKKKVDVRLGYRAISLNTASQKVTLSDGQKISYDQLLIATGSIPLSLPIPGIESKGVTPLRTLFDVEKILEGSENVREVVIIGGGFIGLKLACHLKKRGLGMTVFEKEPKLAARMFDLKASRLIEENLRERGIWVETNIEVAEVLNKKGWVSGVRMKDGRVFSCQRVIEAVGVRPNTQFLIGSGIDLKGGILVDQRMETNIPGIFAAGDVTMTRDSITSEWVNNANWPAATRQGRIAGSNMAGGNRAYIHNFNLNAINLFGLQVMSAGHPYYENEPGIELVINEEGKFYRKSVMREERLIGFLLVGDVSGAGFLLSLMKRRVELSLNQWDQLFSSRTLQHYLPPHLGFDHGFVFENPWRTS
jgi:nitrite reductase (NADH) large subunit